jgi:SAM-dependent methyltransferase
MFYNFLANRRNPGGDTSVGSCNARRCYEKQFHFIQKADALNGRVLEIGPGEGHFARYCRSVGVNYKGIERSPNLQKRLQTEGFDVDLGTAPPLPYDDESFSLVCMMAVIEHMSSYEQAFMLLTESYRVLKPGGKLVVSAPDYLRCGIDFVYWDYTHSFQTTELRIRQILVDSGFQINLLIGFTGAVTSRIVRFPIDMMSFIIHSRFIYWLGNSVGINSWLYKYHKSFEPLIFSISEKYSINY